MILKISFRNQLITLLPVYLLVFILGANYGWVAPTIKHALNEDYPINLHFTTEQASAIVSLHEICRFVGVFATIFLVDKIGRSKLLICAIFVSFVGWTMLLVNSHILSIFASRILFGGSKGIFDVASSIYVGEISSPHTRGIFCSFLTVCFFLGLVFELVAATYFTYTVSVSLTLGVATAMFCSSCFLKESAHHLIMKGNASKAEAHFRWFFGRANDEETRREYQILKNALQAEAGRKLNLFQLLRVPHYRNSLIMVSVLGFVISMTGFWPLMSFVSITFSSTGILGSDELSIIYSFLQLFFSAFSACVISSFKRRSLLLASTSVAFVCHFTSAALFYANEFVAPVPQHAWLTFFTITLYACTHASLISQIISVLASEMFAQKMKAVGCGVCALLRVLGSIITSCVFLPVSQHFGMYMNFLCFAAVCLMIFLWTCFVIPETKGKSLIEIQKSLGNTEHQDSEPKTKTVLQCEIFHSAKAEC